MAHLNAAGVTPGAWRKIIKDAKKELWSLRCGYGLVVKRWPRQEREEQPDQESVVPQTTRSAKVKVNQAAAAAKLEQYAHTPVNLPGKGSQQVQAKAHSVAPADRKSHGHTATGISGTKTVSKKAQEGEIPGAVSVITLDTDLPVEEEPTLKEVLCAVNACRCLLSSLCD